MVVDVYVKNNLFERVSKIYTAKEYTYANVEQIENPNFFKASISAWLSSNSKWVIDDSNISASFLNSVPTGTDTMFSTSAGLTFLDLSDEARPILLIENVSGLSFLSDWVALQPDKRFSYSASNRLYVLLNGVSSGATFTVTYYTASAWNAIANKVKEKAPLGSDVLSKVAPVIFVQGIGTIAREPDYGVLNATLATMDELTVGAFQNAFNAAGGAATFTSLAAAYMTPGGGIFCMSGTTLAKDPFKALLPLENIRFATLSGIDLSGVGCA